MIDRRSSGVASLHTVLLAAEAATCWVALAAVVPHVRGLVFTTLLPFATYPVVLVMSVVVAMGWGGRIEGNLTTLGWADSMRLAFRQTVIVAGGVFTVVVVLKDPGISRVFLAAYFSTLGGLFILLNRFQPKLLVRLVFAGARLPTLVLGDAELFPELSRWLQLREKLGLKPVGVVSYRGRVPQIANLAVVGEFSDLKQAIARTGAQQVLMLNLPHSAEDAEYLARMCASCGCRLLIHNNLTYQLTYPLRILAQDGYSFLAFRDEPLEDPVNRVLKRGVDIALALPVVLLVVPPVALCTWLVQRRQSPGPLFYRQPRYGRAGRSFSILKFRTLHASETENLGQVGKGDDRVYAFGRLLRRTSLDELPQFLNVLCGDMSVVGPRPHFVRHDEEFADAVNEYRVRYFVKPGITGLAQSRGFRGAISTADAIRQRLQLDLDYIHNWSIWLDIAIIARTARQVVRPPPMAQ